MGSARYDSCFFCTVIKSYSSFAGERIENKRHLIDKSLDAVELAHVVTIRSLHGRAQSVVVAAYAVYKFGTYGVGRVSQY